jgi:hypothetical protein
MFRYVKFQSCVLSFWLATVVVSGCGQDSRDLGGGDKPMGLRTSAQMTFAEFKARTTVDSATGYYVVEDDMLMSEDLLREYFDSQIAQNGALILQTQFGVLNKWNDNEKLQLSYCVSQTFSAGDRPTILKFMAQAAAAWNSAANVRIWHAPAEDGKCNTTSGSQQPNVMFRVWPTSGDSSATIGPDGAAPGARYVRPEGSPNLSPARDRNC